MFFKQIYLFNFAKNFEMKKLFFLITLFLVLSACSSDSSSSDTSGDNFNRTELLTNWADNLIIPRYENYQSKVNTLKTAATTFVDTPNEVSLTSLRNSWLEAYKAYQYVGFFTIGKAEEINLNSVTNVYPTNTVGIEANIANSNYNFASLTQLDKQGFPAIDYMINGLATTDAEIIDFYVTNANATKYKQYLTDLTNQLKVNIDLVVTDWNGSYKNTFISSNGNSVSSSTNKMINNFIRYFEKDIRSGKVGIPAGIFLNSNGTVNPTKVEAYYKNDVSKILLNEAIKASQDFFNGKHFNNATEGASLKSYLDFLGTVRNGQNLSTIINSQFATINTVNATLNNSFSTQVISNNTSMIESYDAMLQNLVYLKVDMIQALNVSIDYVDNDGD